VRPRLSGWVVAITRDGDPDDPLAAALSGEGAEVRDWPTLAFAESGDPEGLTEATKRLETFHWIAFTSVRAVDAVAHRSARPGSRTRVAAVGMRTAARLENLGWPVHVVGDGDGAAGLVRALARSGDLAGARVLYPAGSLAGKDLAEGLRGHGAEVARVEAYRTLVCPPDPRQVRRDLARGVHAVTFHSPSAVRGLTASLDGALAEALTGCVVIAAGPTTAHALEHASVWRVAVAERPTPEGMVEACVRALGAGAN